MIIVDSGFLFALADGRDAWHAEAQRHAHTIGEGWASTWPVVTETAYLLGQRLGIRFVSDFLDDVGAGGLWLWQTPSAALQRAAALMRRYATLPMDLADASLVLLAEHLNDGRILSTDMRDFGAYRWKNRKPFTNLMEQPR